MPNVIINHNQREREREIAEKCYLAEPKYTLRFYIVM